MSLIGFSVSIPQRSILRGELPPIVPVYGTAGEKEKIRFIAVTVINTYARGRFIITRRSFCVRRGGGGASSSSSSSSSRNVDVNKLDGCGKKYNRETKMVDDAAGGFVVRNRNVAAIRGGQRISIETNGGTCFEYRFSRDVRPKHAEGFARVRGTETKVPCSLYTELLRATGPIIVNRAKNRRCNVLSDKSST